MSTPPDARAATSAGCTVRRLQLLDDAAADALADVLTDCVAGGASVGFMAPLARERAVAFWRRVGDAVAAGERALLVAEDGQGVCGTVHLVLAQPENQPHRADVTKMLVHRRARRRGVGAALLAAVEVLARAHGRSTLVLDTVTGGDAERLYARHGWVRVGEIPRYALMPDGAPCSTTMFYRTLDASPPATAVTAPA
jgi:GNAT superfamily N-acetyltransferase